MKLATWNVNSVNVRLPQLLDWLTAARPDVVCLQELKCEDGKFPRAPLEAAGYAAAVSGQKTYNGVAILARGAPAEVAAGIPGFADDQKRVLAATIEGVRVVCVYCPNGQSVDYRLTVQDIDNASEGDIHLGTEGANGPLVVKLFHAEAPKKGRFSGVLAQGRFSAADLVGPMRGAPLSDLLEMFAEGNAYVNVHTSDGTDPPNSGPGDYRLGEIRGQIKP